MNGLTVHPGQRPGNHFHREAGNTLSNDAIKGLEPEPVWRYLYELNQIPRGSKNEAAAQAWLLSVAEKLGAEAEQDAAGNVLIRKPATPGRKNPPTVVPQGHTHMVCEKNADNAHDVVNAPSTMLRYGAWITAAGTPPGLPPPPAFFRVYFPALLFVLLVLRAGILVSRDHFRRPFGFVLLGAYALVTAWSYA